MSTQPSVQRPAGKFGVRLAGTGSAVPARRLTNKDLESLMDTSHEWIVQRTGIEARHVHDPDAGETTAHLASRALARALEAASLVPTDLEMVLVATMTPDMPTPSVACTVAHELGAGQVAAMDVNAACSGFVYCLNLAHALIRGGSYHSIGVIGADNITRFVEYSTAGRATSVLFGDGAGAVVLRTTDDASKGLLAQSMHSDGGGAKHLYIPSKLCQLQPVEAKEQSPPDRIFMNGQAVFKFAVGTFPTLIEQTLEKAGIRAMDVDHYICHQSNFRILEAARERFGLTRDRMHVNIDRYGNTVAASVPLILDELTRAGRVEEGQRIMFLAFGAGLTWGSSLWQV